MKKILMIIFVLALANSANAGFETKSDSLADKRAKRAEEELREQREAEFTQKSAEQSVITNGLLTEQNKKIDMLTEEMKNNNTLMQELLDRLQ